MTYQILEKYLHTTEQRYDKLTGKLISSAHSTPTLTSLEVLISTITYSSVLPAECKVTVYKLSASKKG
jgi:serine/threonine-protein kinase RIO1